MQNAAWESFNLGAWTEEIDIQDFIQRNYAPYTGGDDFLQPASTFAARGALATGLMRVKVRQSGQGLDHATRLVHHDHCA